MVPSHTTKGDQKHHNHRSARPILRPRATPERGLGGRDDQTRAQPRLLAQLVTRLATLALGGGGSPRVAGSVPIAGDVAVVS
jgi:hypothetical protein